MIPTKRTKARQPACQASHSVAYAPPAATSSVVGALLDDPAVGHHGDLVALLGLGEPVGDHHGRAAGQRGPGRPLQFSGAGASRPRRWPRPGSPPAGRRARSGPARPAGPGPRSACAGPRPTTVSRPSGRAAHPVVGADHRQRGVQVVVVGVRPASSRSSPERPANTCTSWVTTPTRCRSCTGSSSSTSTPPIVTTPSLAGNTPPRMRGQGRLARAALPHDGQRASGRHRDVHAVQHLGAPSR